MENEKQLQELEFYKDELRKLKEENIELASKITTLEAQKGEVEQKLAQIKGSLPWKLSKPLRLIRVGFIRLGYYKSPKKIARKIRNKRLEKRSHKYFGTQSLPNETERGEQESWPFKEEHKISILVPLYNTPENFLREMIDSVITQTYKSWELCLADGSDAEHAYVGEICRDYVAKDSRIVYHKLEKNEGISGNTNQCYKLATGDYIGLFDHDDILHPSVLFEYARVIEEQGADYVYCDEATFTGNSINNMITLHFKPDYAIDTLRANNYICHFSVFKKTLLQETELFRKECDGSQDHDMILRLTSIAKKVVHVPRILYYWRAHAGSVASNINAKTYCIDSAKRAVSDHLHHYNIYNTAITSTRAFETIFRLQYELTTEGMVSVLIPNCDHVEELRKCVEAIRRKNSYENYEIIVIENNSKDEETFKYYEEIEKDPKVRILKYEGEFNYARLNNIAAKEAKGEFLLLLNNDVEFINKDFIKELLMYAQRNDVGAVGAKLLFPDDTIQHAGIIIGLGAHRTAGHIHYKDENTHIGYMGRLCYAQNVSAVTGAALMVKKADYDAVGGLDEKFAVALNDVDFCLRLREKGLLNVFTPFAEAYHYESASRGLDNVPEKAKRYEEECELFRERCKELLEKGDPYYKPNFTLDRSDYSLNVPKK
ncbi:MAG: glycosyltransferase family 2 protein [Lachnospiraceae bacterium]|nr:glycosyltransferase family 2 protein [Lachnospiraceae bacterium]